MPNLKIVSKRANETDPAFPEITEENFAGEGELNGAAILEKGMTSGKPSIGLMITQADGKKLMVQTSAEIIKLLAVAIEGTTSYWENNPL